MAFGTIIYGIILFFQPFLFLLFANRSAFGRAFSVRVYNARAAWSAVAYLFL